MSNPILETITARFLRELRKITLENLRESSTTRQLVATRLVMLYGHTGTVGNIMRPSARGQTIDKDDIDKDPIALKNSVIEELKAAKLKGEDLDKIKYLFENVALNAISNIKADKASFSKFCDAIDMPLYKPAISSSAAQRTRIQIGMGGARIIAVPPRPVLLRKTSDAKKPATTVQTQANPARKLSVSGKQTDNKSAPNQNTNVAPPSRPHWKKPVETKKQRASTLTRHETQDFFHGTPDDELKRKLAKQREKIMPATTPSPTKK